MIDLNEFLSKLTIVHLDPNGTKYLDDNPYSAVMALSHRDDVTFIENIDVSFNKVPYDKFSTIKTVKIDYEPEEITRNKNTYKIPIYRYGGADYLENIKIDTKLDLLNVFIKLSKTKTRLKFVKQDTGYIIDVSYIHLLCLYDTKIYLFLDFSKKEDLDFSQYPEEDMNIYFNYGFMDTDLRRELGMNTVIFTVQGVRYIAEYEDGGYCKKECTLCDLIDEDIVIKLQRIYRKRYEYNPYHPLGKRMIEEKCKEIEEYISMASN